MDAFLDILLHIVHQFLDVEALATDLELPFQDDVDVLDWIALREHNLLSVAFDLFHVFQELPDLVKTVDLKPG